MSSFSPTVKNQFLVTLVRHGETALNAQRLLQGQTDVPLSDVGIEQAEILGKHLSNVKFTRAYSSDLCRARETAELILRHSKNPITIKTDKRIRERCFGEAEGKHASEFMKEASKIGLNVIDYTPRGGETSSAVSLRAGSFFQELCELIDSLENVEGEHALIVSHGGLMANLMRHLNSCREIYFLKNFNESDGFKIAPNTGITTFAITKLPRGIVKRRLIIFDKFNNANHLINQTCPFMGN
jgi:broad specificity phosphatase PhoE